MPRSLDRRSFLESSAASGAAFAAGSYFVSESPAQESRSANSRVAAALMGANGRGGQLATSYLAQTNTEIGYICDVDERVINRMVSAVSNRQERKPSGVADFRKATVVAVGNDFDLSYDRLAAAARAAAAGAPLVTPNVDPRLPIENGDFLPGCGALVAAVCAAAGVSPIVIGKPEPPLFRIALRRLGLTPAQAAMVGDSAESDVAGGRGVGMRTVLYAPAGAPAGAADVVVRSWSELARRAGV